MVRKRPKPSKELGRLPSNPVVLVPIIAGVFQALNVGAAFHTAPTARAYGEWYPVHAGPSPVALELEHGVDTRRWRYNGRGFRLAHRAQRPVLTALGGLYDFFVPFGRHHGARTTLVVGPFARSRPNAGEVLQRWREIGGGHGRLTDPAFVRYLTAIRAVLTLEGPRLGELERLLGCFAALRAREDTCTPIAEEVQALMSGLARARAAERMWDAARAMIDDAREWSIAIDAQELVRLGVTRVPEEVLVGLLQSRGHHDDGVDDLLRRDALLRACADLASERGGMVAGRLGDHGLVLLVEAGRARPRLREVAQKVRALAKPLGFELFFGSTAGPAGSAAIGYRAALGAAERALATGVPLLQTKAMARSQPSSVAMGRRALRAALRENPSLLVPSFQRYMEVASARAGYRVEPVRAYLEVALDDIVEALEPAGAFDRKGLAELRSRAEIEAAQAETVGALCDAHRRIVEGIAHALSAPEAARRDRSFERAIAYVRDHLGEPLSRAKIAKVAGFAEHYFSKRFRENEGTTFQAFVKGLRVERSKQMLRSTSLSVERVAELSGFGTRVQFHRSFKRAVGMTPAAFRARPS